MFPPILWKPNKWGEWGGGRNLIYHPLSHLKNKSWKFCGKVDENVVESNFRKLLTSSDFSPLKVFFTVTQKEHSHFLFLGISGSFRRRRSVLPDMKGRELVLASTGGWAGWFVLSPSPISSSSALLVLKMIWCPRNSPPSTEILCWGTSSTSVLTSSQSDPLESLLGDGEGSPSSRPGTNLKSHPEENWCKFFQKPWL